MLHSIAAYFSLGVVILLGYVAVIDRRPVLAKS